MTELMEGLQEHDLDDLLLPLVSIDEYEPKTGDDKDVIVVGWFVDDEKPARDLERFIEKGDNEILDTETSPAPNPEGYYLVFVEFLRNEQFPENLISVLGTLGNLTNVKEWQFKPLHQDEIFDINEENIKEHIELDPEEIGTTEKGEEELEHKEMGESVEHLNEIVGWRPGRVIPNPYKTGANAENPEYGDWCYTVINPAGKEEVIDDCQYTAPEAKQAMRGYVQMMNRGNDEGRSEAAMQAGMGHGIQGYNDYMGEAEILAFFKPSLNSNVTVRGNQIVLERLGHKKLVTAIAFGSADELYEKFNFKEMPLRLDEDARNEANKLAFYLGNDFGVDAFDKYLAISGANNIMLLVAR
jgi:hypothetical protein